MKKMTNFDNAKPYEGGAVMKLPVGGYVCGVREARVEDIYNKEYLTIVFDIAEGEHKSFFIKQLQASTYPDAKNKGVYRMLVPSDDAELEDKALRRFKTFINNIEASNSGFKWVWNELTLVGKYFGAIFGEKEYDFNGRQGVSVVLRSTIDVNSIRSGEYTIPELWKLSDSQSTVGKLTEVDDGGTLPF